MTEEISGNALSASALCRTFWCRACLAVLSFDMPCGLPDGTVTVTERPAYGTGAG